MGTSIFKDIKDAKENKEAKDVKDEKEYVEVYKPRWPLDPLGPVKYDVADRLIQSYLELLPQVGQRIEAIEDHLEKGSGEPFVRPTERPDVGGTNFGELTETLNLLNERVAKLEKKRGR